MNTCSPSTLISHTVLGRLIDASGLFVKFASKDIPIEEIVLAVLHIEYLYASTYPRIHSKASSLKFVELGLCGDYVALVSSYNGVSTRTVV